MSFMEPFRIKMVEPLTFLTREERIKILEDSGSNPFKLDGRHVTFDFATDSGTGAMSQHQWAAMMQADEGYFSSRSFKKLEDCVKSLTGFQYMLPAHQGRAVEHLLFSILSKPGMTIFSNTLFPTTRGNADINGLQVVDLPCVGSPESFFNANIDCVRLKEELETMGPEGAIVVLVVASTSQAGQPVSMSNIQDLSQICHSFDIPLIMDGCRFAENAYFIKTRDKEYSLMSCKDIALKMFSYFDHVYVSAKKDGLCNTGAFLATNQQDVYDKASARMLYTEGFKTSGGLTGRDMEAMTVGLLENIDDKFLQYRVDSTYMFGDILKKAGVHVIDPIGCGLYINGAKCLPHIPTCQYPAFALHCALYIEGGIRCVQIDDVLKLDESNERENPKPQHILRIQIPRRVYTLSHMLHVGEIFMRIMERRESISGMRVIDLTSSDFTAILEPVKGKIFDD
ncbi:tryptophanase-like [Haliotis cracherodii]|uniref:tryptophanase-like n=1 Tax=Haliotis cracherodii TaxID=6455 RepID=UPI0039EC9230